MVRQNQEWSSTLLSEFILQVELMDKVPLVCSRMATVVGEYCHLIDTFEGLNRDNTWLSRMGRMLPRLHVAVIALVPTSDRYGPYRFPDDDKRCELYMRLHNVLQTDQTLKKVYGQSSLRHQCCDQLADDFTDMYFDLRLGLELLPIDPVKATNLWLSSFYIHWGQHLLDAENRLHAVEAGEEPLCLTGWGWPRLAYAAA